MLIVMSNTATNSQIDEVVAVVERNKCKARPMPGGDRVAIGVLHNKGPLDAALFLGLEGVKDVIPVTRPYKLVSREFKSEDTIVSVGGVNIGNGHMTMIAGPCAIESEEQALTIAGLVKEAGATIFRGGPSNLAPHPIPFRDWEKRACRSWRGYAKRPACRW